MNARSRQHRSKAIFCACRDIGIRSITPVLMGLLYLCITSANGQETPTFTAGYLRDERTFTPLDAAHQTSSRRLIVLVHGWTRRDPWDPPADQYYTGPDSEWSNALTGLIPRLEVQLISSDWIVATFHWEQDASTGGIDLPDLDGNAVTAAQHAVQHGPELAQLIQAAVPNAREVHFISHSAGSWAAKVAMESLLQNAPFVVTSMTLLDPFVPNELGLTESAMNALVGNSNADRIHRLENYYAGDITGLSTARHFDDWSCIRDINARVDFGNGFSNYYQSHSGPIQFYSDSVGGAGGTIPPNPSGGWVTSCGINVDFSSIGYFPGLAYRDAIGARPRISAQPQSQTIVTGNPLTLNVTAPHATAWTWYKDGAFQGNGPSLTIQNVSAVHGGRYIVRVSNSNGLLYSDEALITVAASPPQLSAPTNLLASAAAATQINISWFYNSSGQTGFEVERATGGGTFSHLAWPTSGARSYSDMSCSPVTTYSYRVKAMSGSSSSAPSNTATATTPQQAGTTAVLAITSTNPSSGVPVNSFVGNTNFQSGFTPMSRSFTIGTTVGVTCPQTLTNGAIFQKWQLDGVDRGFTTYTTVVMNSAHTLTAVFGPSQPPSHTLSSLTVEGPSSVNENSSTPYSARATYSDGSSGYVAASWSDDSNYATISSSGVLTAGEVSSDKDIEVRAEYSEGGVTRSKVKSVTIRNTNTATGYTLSVSAQNGDVFVSPNLGSYPAGTQVYLHAHADSGYIFDHWSGNASGSDSTIYLTMNGNKSVTANFAVDTRVASVSTNIQPAGAVTAGAQWKLGPFGAWHNSGEQFSVNAHNDTLFFKDIPGWVTPYFQNVEIVGGQNYSWTGTYTEILGAIQATISPPEAVNAGAQWRVDGGAWQNGGVTVANLSPGSHTVDFRSISGWQTPATQTVSVSRGSTSIVTGNYGPPAGLPIISSISPNTGPITGGTAVSIIGVNFQPGATAAFGGVTATSVTVVDSSHITAVTPARASYGSVTVAVTVNGQTTTVPNGFSYLIPLGSNMELVGQIGGTVNAVTISGNYMYIGEGTSLVVFDVTNPSSPIERGRIALPSRVQNDIVIVGSRAYVANGLSGLYVVDVSSPTSPGILGFYDTDGVAEGILLDGTLAYVADGSRGLVILNVSDPTAITRVGGIEISPGNMEHIAVGTIGSDKYAFLGGYQAAVNIVKVTNPQSPAFVTSIPVSSFLGVSDVKIAGTTLYFGDQSGDDAGAKIYSVSNPMSPTRLASFHAGVEALDVVGNRLYFFSGNLSVADVTNPASPSLLNGAGYIVGAAGNRMVVVNGLAYVTGIRSAQDGTDGTKILSVSNPTAISVRSTIQHIGAPAEVCLKNTVAYLGMDNINGTDGFHPIDVTNPARPTRLGSLRSIRASGIIVNGNTAVTTDYNNGPRTINVTNPAAPTQLAQFTQTIGYDIALLGNNPVVVGQTTGSPPLPKLTVLDISNPSSPTSIGILSLGTTAGSATCIAIAGQWGFVGHDSSTLDVINLATLSSPAKVSSLPVPSGYIFANNIGATADSNYVFVSKDGPNGGGIAVIDATIKSSPVLVASINPPQNPGSATQSLTVSGNRLFAADNQYCYVYDISVPTAAQQLAYYQLPSNGRGIDTSGDLVYVANSTGGLQILRVRDTTAPIVTIATPTTAPTYTTNSSTITLGGSASGVNGVSRVTWQNSRGGGGTAQGTTMWSVPNAQLTSGQNVITVTAEGSNGNLGSRTLTVTCTLPDTTPPVVTITAPRQDVQYSVNASSISVSGTAADGVSVANVVWNNDRGGSGTAVGTTNWAIADLPLFEGPNVITVTAYDSSGNAGGQAQIITFAPDDTTVPNIEVDFPTINPTWSTSDSMLNISGTAADDRAIAAITWENDRGGNGTASGGDIWYVNDIPLQLGNNVITVTATDAAGNGATDMLVVNRGDVTGPTPTPSVTPTPVPTPTPVFPVQLGNIATRLRVGIGDNALIGGFIVTGTQSKTVIVRGIGPSLTPFGIAGALADPIIEVHGSSGELLATDDNWNDDPNNAQHLIQTGLAPTHALESARWGVINPGAYTVVVRGKNNTTGVGLIEVYDLDRTVNSKLANISTRGFVDTGENVMIGGMIVVGSTPANVLIRAIGPSLTNFGVPNALPNPTLELHDGNGVLLESNDNWRSDHEAQIQATGLPPSNDLESAILRNLVPGAYTAIVRGSGSSTGVAVVEAYQLQ